MCTDATHIFDGLSGFPTHIVHMRFGEFLTEPIPWPPTSSSSALVTQGSNSTLYHVALQWLKEDRIHRRELEKAGKKTRGARRDEVSA